jgi:glucose-1-phosphate thymidylyltransferase
VNYFKQGYWRFGHRNFNVKMQAGQFVQVEEGVKDKKVGCIERIAWRQGFISRQQLKILPS